MAKQGICTNAVAVAQISIESTFLAVRHGLATLLAQEPLRTASRDCRETVEIVLAEVLNNIVEHAYAHQSGLIEVSITRAGGDLRCLITDRGAPMPGEQAPAGALGAINDADLPEGGFGWFMIRSMTQDLTYARNGDQNRLNFRIAAS